MTGPKVPTSRKRPLNCNIYGHAVMPNDYVKRPDGSWYAICPVCKKPV